MTSCSAHGHDATLRLADALYVELAVSRGLPLVTSDRRLHAVPTADIVQA